MADPAPSPPPAIESADAVVIGLGAAGCAAVWALAEAGASVLALEAGPHLAPERLAVRVGQAPWWRRVPIGRTRVQARAVSFHPRLAPLYVDDRLHPYSTRGGDPFLWIRGRQVGGRLHTWARMALRLGPDDFRRTDATRACSWPLRYEDVAPHYAAVERFLGLRGGRDGLDSPPDGCVTEEVGLRPEAELFAERLRASGSTHVVVPPRVLLHDVDPVPAMLRAALATGRVRVLDRSPAARLLLSAGGERVVGVETATPEGGRRVVAGDLVVLAASTIETVRLLWNSAGGEHPAGVGNDHDRLGRGVMDHHFVVAMGPTDAAYRALADRVPPRASHLLALHEDLDVYLPRAERAVDGRDFLRGFGIQGKVTPTFWSLGAFCEMLPDPDNRVSVDGRRLDVHGVPAARIAVRRRRNDLRIVRAARRELLRIARAVGFHVRYPGPPGLRGLLWRAVGPELGVLHLGLGIHELGGAAMAARPGDGVVDPDHRVFGVDNLLVVDGACFPSCGCQNPTLTILALARRAALRACGRDRGG